MQNFLFFVSSAAKILYYIAGFFNAYFSLASFLCFRGFEMRREPTAGKGMCLGDETSPQFSGVSCWGIGGLGRATCDGRARGRGWSTMHSCRIPGIFRGGSKSVK